jgi:membrane protein YqaA with SNARE-associated domain
VDEGSRRSRGSARLVAVGAAVVITIAAFVIGLKLQELPDSERRALYERFGYLAVFLISLVGNATVIIPAPTFVVAFTGGLFLNPWLVGVVAAAGATLGELTGYMAGLGGQAVIENREMYERFERWMRRYGLVTLFVLAAIPNPFFDVAGLVAGALGLPVWQFLVAAWAGKTVKFLALAFLGAGSTRLIEQYLQR